MRSKESSFTTMVAANLQQNYYVLTYNTNLENLIKFSEEGELKGG